MRSGTVRLQVVIDTNLFVSAAIVNRGNPHALLRAWRNDRFGLITSQQQRDELASAMRRPRVRKYGVTEEEIHALLRRLISRATLVEPLIPLPLPVRDAKDEPILGMAFAGEADYLVTGDEDLLSLRGDSGLGNLQIVTVAEFLAVLDVHVGRRDEEV